MLLGAAQFSLARWFTDGSAAVVARSAVAITAQPFLLCLAVALPFTGPRLRVAVVLVRHVIGRPISFRRRRARMVLERMSAAPSNPLSRPAPGIWRAAPADRQSTDARFDLAGTAVPESNSQTYSIVTSRTQRVWQRTFTPLSQCCRAHVSSSPSLSWATSSRVGCP